MKNALLYFALVFGAGFVLGTVRVTLLLPRVGERTAELIEAPLMLGAIVLAARWITRRTDASASELMRSGLIAAAMVLGADVVVGLALRDMTLVDIFFDRDPVAGSVYYVLIVAFALMPWLLARDRGPTRGGVESA